MTNPTQGSVHVNQPLTDLSVAMLQDADMFIADRVFPVLRVSKQSDRYYVYDRGEFNRDEMALRAPGTESAGGGYSLDSTPTYFAPVWSLHKDIDDQVRENADSVLDVDREAVAYLTQKAMIKKEKLFADSFLANGVWGTDLDGVASAPTAGQTLHWSDVASTPIEDVRAGQTGILSSTGKMANTLVLGHEVYAALIDHPDIVDRVKYGQTAGGPALVGEQALAALFGVDRVLVSRAIENSAAEGQAASHGFIAGKQALLCHVAPSVGLMTPTAGLTFAWTGMGGAEARVRKFRMEHLESDRVELSMAFDQKLVAADLGYLWNGIIA